MEHQQYQRLRKVVANLHEESRSLWLPKTVRSYDTLPDALTFLRDHVTPSLPCVLRGACCDWPATTDWSRDNFCALRQKVGHKSVQVTVTPDGYADAIVPLLHEESGGSSRVFAEPMLEKMTISDILDACTMMKPLHDNGGIPYYSAQNSNLINDVPELIADVHELPFAQQVFYGDAVDKKFAAAVNLWIGDERSVTTMHADPFENLYAVVKGCKSFTLRPPCDAAILPKPELQRAKWMRMHGKEGKVSNDDEECDEEGEILLPRKPFPGWCLQNVEGRIAWIDEDAIDESMRDVVIVDVNEGDMLYLPALWCTFSHFLVVYSPETNYVLTNCEMTLFCFCFCFFFVSFIVCCSFRSSSVAKRIYNRS